MDDRELYLNVAKAIGIDGYVAEDHNGIYFCTPANPDDYRSKPMIYKWLDDDGDAFRLALKARVTLRFEDNAPAELKLPRRCAVAIFADGKYIAESVMNDDEAGSMRMALVRAVVEIAKNMP